MNRETHKRIPRQKIEDAIEQRNKHDREQHGARSYDAEGDEGLLYRIELDDTAYFIKQWKTKQGKVEFIKESNRTTVSPYWHHLKAYEHELAYSLFPEDIVPVVATYDPRVQTDTAGNTTFMHRSGRPVTVTPEVQADAALLKQRDVILDNAYAQKKQALDVDKEGRLRAQAQEPGTLGTMRLIRMAADADIRGLLGKELNLDNLDLDSSIPKRIDRLIQKAQEINPQSRMLKLLKAGIMPLHPEFNFIPTGARDEKGPQGVYLEITISDTQKLQDALYKKIDTSGEQTTKREVDQKLRAYFIYRRLDQMYDQIFHPVDEMYDAASETRKASFIKDAGVQNFIFQIMEDARTSIEKKEHIDVEHHLRAIQIMIEKALEADTKTEAIQNLVHLLDHEHAK